ncbi:hypothetical protein BO71DRAFT_173128 [Aspergillus ellipticus CBS 707.79]|uniref:Uncharacterized protein n=1 Tax=Aspergillus ellipticus CBS 707.79 TaxID=1448320 RepID=A0A319DTY4_9EURO|nr:hypothetical protein BO71DRAFT_173128 [Aspergillus ellipticus CBS 707.79]
MMIELTTCVVSGRRSCTRAYAFTSRPTGPAWTIWRRRDPDPDAGTTGAPAPPAGWAAIGVCFPSDDWLAGWPADDRRAQRQRQPESIRFGWHARRGQQPRRRGMDGRAEEVPGRSNRSDSMASARDGDKYEESSIREKSRSLSASASHKQR